MFYANSGLHAFLLVPLNKTHMQESLASNFILEWQEILGLEKLTSKSKCIFLGEQVDNRTAYQNVFYTGRNLNQAHVKHSHEGDTCTG